MDLLTAEFHEIKSALQLKKISAHEIATFFLNRITALDSNLNSYTHINTELLNQARSLDQKIADQKEIPPLAGICFGIKDLICTQGMPTTSGSRILQSFVPPYNATAVQKLLDAGALLTGKLNQDEFAMGSTNETSYYGAVKNPWDLSRVPGGSSGGSAAAQASRLNLGTLGTDTGGSIRQPSSFCGLVGVKPTYGRVSRYGMIAYASSLDQAGPIVSSVKDAALTLEVICGQDKKDGTTSNKEVESFSSLLNPNIKGKKVGYIKEHLDGITDSSILKTTQLALQNLQSLGAEIVEISIPLTQYAVPMYYIISASEASSNLSRYDGVKYGYRSHSDKFENLSLDDFYCLNRSEGFGEEVKRRILLGTYCLSSGYYEAFYLKASKVRRMLRQQFLDAFEKCDVLVGPVTTSPAYKIGEKSVDPMKSYLNDIFTTATNLSGLPGMSLPYGFAEVKNDQGVDVKLPLGVQITAQHFDEQTLLNFAYALEQTDHSLNIRKHKPYVY